jgi:hypothetical protein
MANVTRVTIVLAACCAIPCIGYKQAPEESKQVYLELIHTDVLEHGLKPGEGGQVGLEESDCESQQVIEVNSIGTVQLPAQACSSLKQPRHYLGCMP